MGFDGTDEALYREFPVIDNSAVCASCDRLRSRVRELEATEENWKAIVADEMAENIKLFNLLGVMPEIEAGRAGTDAVVDAIQKLKADLAATQAALKEKLRALKDIRALLVVRPHRFADQTEKIHAVIDRALSAWREK